MFTAGDAIKIIKLCIENKSDVIRVLFGVGGSYVKAEVMLLPELNS